MQPRIDYSTTNAKPLRTMLELEKYLSTCTIEKPIRELVKLHVSQINGCAYCIDMHWKDARADGETEQRLYGLPAWRESPYYTHRERAALRWAEEVTRLSGGEVSDAAYDEAKSQFSEEEIVDLTWAVVAINGWNRLSIALRTKAGDYQPSK